MEEKRFKEITTILGELRIILEEKPKELGRYIDQHPEPFEKEKLIQFYDYAEICLKMNKIPLCQEVEFITELLFQTLSLRDSSDQEQVKIPDWVAYTLRGIGMEYLPPYREKWLTKAIESVREAEEKGVLPLLEALHQRKYDAILGGYRQIRKEFALQEKHAERLLLNLMATEVLGQLIANLNNYSKEELEERIQAPLSIIQNAALYATMLNSKGCMAKYADWEGTLISYLQGIDTGLEHYQKALGYYREINHQIQGYDILLAGQNYFIAHRLVRENDPERAIPYLEESVKYYRQVLSRGKHSAGYKNSSRNTNLST